MGRQMPWDDIPDSNVFQPGDYHMQGVQLKEAETAEGKLMYSAELVVLEHPATTMYTNMHYFENFVIGNDDDPDAQVPGTWQQSFGAKAMKKMLGSAQIPGCQGSVDMDKVMASFAGCQVIGSLTYHVEPDLDRDGNPNRWAGQERNRSKWAKVGSKEPELRPMPGAAKTAGQGPTMAAPAPPPGAAADPPVNQPYVPTATPQAAPAQAPAPQPQPQAATPMGQPAYVAPAAQPGGGGQTAAPGAVPPAMPQAPTNPAPSGATSASGVGGPAIQCPNCQGMFAPLDFAAHIQTCQGPNQAV